MSEEITPIARIRLARSPLRLLAAPFAFALTGASAVVGGWMLGGIGGAGLAIAGSLAIGCALFLALFVFSVSVAIEPGTVHLRWLTGERRYALVRGSLTRVTVLGAGRATLRARFGAIGWSLGRAELPGEEQIDVVRLAATPTMIVIPTDLGRLAIAAASETELIEALGTAARMQQRMEAAIAARPPVAAVIPAVPLPAPPPRPLTGIERALLEERLAAERAAAEAAAASERLAAAALAATDTPTPQPLAEAVSPAAPQIPIAPARSTVTAVTRARPRQRAAWRRPSWVHFPRPGPGPAPVAMSAATVAAASVAAPRVSARAVVRRRMRVDFSTVGEVLVLGAPLAAAAAVWITWFVGGAIFSPTDARLLTLALALGGIGGALGALAARAWYPRLGPLVSMTAVAALALVARAAIA